jgi:DNA-binding response OmpR family regulator
MRVLIVDDHPPTRDLLTRSMTRVGHVAVAEATCAAAAERLASEHFEVAILDVMLPDGSGMDLCRSLRDGGCAMPILLLTARGGVGDRVAGLDAGADDYLAKPFAMAELVARVRALARRGPAFRSEAVCLGLLRFDAASRKVTLDDQPLRLTAREFAIIEVLVRNVDRVVQREHLVEAVWGDPDQLAANSLEVLIARIRRKFGGESGRLETIRGVGYLLSAS